MGPGRVLWAEAWKRRGALMYTVGAWTVFGSVIYYTSGYIKKEPPPVMPEGKETVSIVSADGLKETTIYRKKGSAYYTISTTEYEPDFVPYSIRLQNYIQSFFDDRDSKGK